MKQSGIMPVKQIKVNNIKNILSILLTYGKCTKMDLVNYTQLSNTTLSESINNLCKLNIVRTEGLEESIGGRRPTVYSINYEYGYFIGLVIDGEGVKASVVNFGGMLIKSYPISPLGSKATILLVYEVLEKIKLDFKDKNLLSIGIGATGTVDYKTGVIQNSEEINWHNVHIKELIERKFFIPTYVDHKMNNAVFYESLVGNAIGTDNFMLICNDCKDKVGVYVDGSIIRGEDNIAGSLSYSDLTLEETNFIKKFLSLKKVLYTYTTKPDNIDQMRDTKAFQINEDYFTTVSAVMAEVNWYESIYFKM